MFVRVCKCVNVCECICVHVRVCAGLGKKLDDLIC